MHFINIAIFSNRIKVKSNNYSLLYNVISGVPIPRSDAKIWRYTNLEKFIDMLQQNALWFAKINKLYDIDPYEGRRPSHDLKLERLEEDNRGKFWAEFLDRTGTIFETRHQKERAIEMLVGDPSSLHEESQQRLRENSFVNCWHVDEYESATMWKLYSTFYSGIAIQSTFEKLQKSLEVFTECTIQYGLVSYIDEEKEGVGEGWKDNKHFFVKRKSFLHENELRAAIFENYTYSTNKPIITIDDGIHVNADLDKLIETIYISPTAKSYFKNTVEKLIKIYNLNKVVKKSNLLELK